MRAGRVFGVRHRRASRATEPWKQREPGDPRLGWGEFAKARNYFDLLRGLAGGLAIVGWHMIDGAVTVAEGAAGGGARGALLAKIAIIVVGVLLQTVRYERQRLSFFAPVFYIAGVSAALCGPWAALFAFIMIWAITPLFPSAGWFLTVYGGVMFCFSYFFKDTGLFLTATAFVIAFLPVLLSLLTRRPLVVFTRKAVSGSSG